jgi:PPP family 3-phenylpropionic acid transporter
MSKATALRVIYFLVFCCTGAWLPKLYDYCVYKGLTETESALILSITPIMMFVVQPVYGFIADKLGYKKTLLLSTLLASLSYLGYLRDNGFAALIIVTVIMSLFYNTIQPVLDSMALQIAKSNPRFSYGSLRFFGAAGFAFTTIITGQVIDAIDITVIFMVSSITMLLAFIFCFFLENEVRAKSEASAYGNVCNEEPIITIPAFLRVLCVIGCYDYLEFLLSLSEKQRCHGFPGRLRVIIPGIM